jgi:DNA-directed RNA polymerase specialized sigma24 family protein
VDVDDLPDLRTPPHRFEWLFEAIDELDPVERDVVESIFFQGSSATATAVSLGLTLSTVEGALRRAFARLESAVRVHIALGKVSAEDLEASALLRSLALDTEPDLP